jgi:hypothetical protein
MTPDNILRPHRKYPHRRSCKTCRNARRRRLTAYKRQHRQAHETTTALVSTDTRD